MAHLPTNCLRTTLLVAALSAPACASESGLGLALPGLKLWALLSLVALAFGFVRKALGRKLGARKLGAWTLHEQVGSGNMGAVYRATHPTLGRAAIKVLHAERSSPRDRARFEREVQVAQQLRHSNTVSVLDSGFAPSGAPFYVMEYVEGVDLQTLVEREGPLPAARVIDLLAQASAALCQVHALGVVHRDIKPANLMLVQRPGEPARVKLVDFGLAEQLGASRPDVLATDVDTISGTPLYLAPEAITADEIDARTDLYALGAVGYFLLTGQSVFSGRSLVELCSKHLFEVPVAPSHRIDRDIPEELEAILLACLAKSPAARPASAANLRAALLRCEQVAAEEAAGASLAALRRVSEIDLEPFAATLSSERAVFDALIPMHILGWQNSLDRLQAYVEAQAA